MSSIGAWASESGPVSGLASSDDALSCSGAKVVSCASLPSAASCASLPSEASCGEGGPTSSLVATSSMSTSVVAVVPCPSSLGLAVSSLGPAVSAEGLLGAASSDGSASAPLTPTACSPEGSGIGVGSSVPQATMTRVTVTNIAMCRITKAPIITS